MLLICVPGGRCAFSVALGEGIGVAAIKKKNTIHTGSFEALRNEIIEEDNSKMNGHH